MGNRVFIKPESKKASILSYCTGGYLFLHYIEAALRWPLLKSINFHFTLGLLLTFFCILKFNSTKNNAKSTGVFEHDNKPLLNITYLFLFIMLFYTVFSLDHEESLRVFINHVLKYSLIAFFIYISVDNIKDLQVIIIFLLLAWFKISLEGGVGWLTGGLIWQNQGVMRLHGATMFVRHPNSFSVFGVGCLFFGLYIFKGFRPIWLKLIVASIIFFGVVVIIFTASRSGYLTVLLTSILIILRMKRHKIKVFLLTLLILLSLLPLLSGQYFERFNSIFTGIDVEGNSIGARKQLMLDALDIYVDYPLGIGVQAFSSVRIDMFDRFQNIHMLYLEVLTNIGPIGFIVFALFIKRMITLNQTNIKNTDIKVQDNDKNNDLIFLNALSKAIIAFLVSRLIFDLFAMDLYEEHWWLMLGLTLSVHKLTLKINSQVKTKN